jgi:hypothetical protein
MKTIIAKKRPGSAVTEEVRNEAIARGSEPARCQPHAITVRYLAERRAIQLDFEDSTAIILPVKDYAELVDLPLDELNGLSLGFGGSALCLPQRDLYVSIAGMVAASGPLLELATAAVDQA